MFFFFRARAEKGIAQDIDTSRVVGSWGIGTLLENGELANQIARQAAFVVKIYLTRGVPEALARRVFSWEVHFDQTYEPKPTTTPVIFVKLIGVQIKCLFEREKACIIYYWVRDYPESTSQTSLVAWSK